VVCTSKQTGRQSCFEADSASESGRCQEGYVWFFAYAIAGANTCGLLVEAKKKGKRFNREQITPLSGLDIDALLDDGGSKSISVENSIPEFRQTLNRATSDAEIQSAAKQLGDIIRKLVKESVGDASYARALENLRVMREEMMEIAMPEIFNEYIKSLKPQLMHGELDSNAGGSGREFWVHIKRSRLGLIDEVASDASTISTEEATAVSATHTPETLD
jgi:ATP-dependent DNA helicase 2 subunit 2